MDPAHNQRDIFQYSFSEKPRNVADNLAVKEVDTDYWIEKYLKETQKTLKQTYSYESAFNLQNYFNVLQFSPGLEEYALLSAFENIIRTHKDKDVIIFDMAPTALTLRFFSLPFITLIWLSELLKLRNRIYAKKEIISRIKIGKKVIEQDKVKTKLEGMIKGYEYLSDQFKSEPSKLNLVMNEDKLSFAEAFRIKQKLTDIKIKIDSVIVNKSQKDEFPAEVEEGFKEQKAILFPMSDKKLLGFEALEEYIISNRNLFLKILSV